MIGEEIICCPKCKDEDIEITDEEYDLYDIYGGNEGTTFYKCNKCDCQFSARFTKKYYKKSIKILEAN